MPGEVWTQNLKRPEGFCSGNKGLSLLTKRSVYLYIYITYMCVNSPHSLPRPGPSSPLGVGSLETKAVKVAAHALCA